MMWGAWSPLEWLALLEHELLLFAGIFFLIGAADEFAMDLAWAWLRLTGRARTRPIGAAAYEGEPLLGRAAVLIPAWREERVIATTIAHALAVWPHSELRIYAGHYRNDSATAAAIVRGAGGDPRVCLVVHDQDGPTTKADCLNCLYAEMEADERRSGAPFRMVVLHDAEDMVDPAALGLLDAALAQADFVQLPVLPEPQRASRWIGSHYCEEFAEAHGKAMVVRSEVGASLPAAGVGCAFDRRLLGTIAREMRGTGPFSVDSLTEDYELGMKIKAAGGRSLFLRARRPDGRLVATRACFPPTWREAVIQKSRWIHGIALQGWDRLGWSGGWAEHWMRLRDRRGPLSALVLFAAYMLLLVVGILWLAGHFGFARPWQPGKLLTIVLWIDLASFGWRAAVRFAFTAREYGALEGLRALLRLPHANIVAIMAARRALFDYVATLCGAKLRWDKTHHEAHPATLRPMRRAG
ncbi:glycosyl transferase family protein [Altererythrobacter soli]|uniref:Glycosyl transferase family protein n=1 Tax=Croceibacterium soli TaxID=1739690 RepID=A0A6I4UV96_9SPHN|nr:glycosyl transferase family protein [Croceibacterium soli]MXP41764.1 glycosyl transferase family protein [Croceibacterium soli]